MCRLINCLRSAALGGLLLTLLESLLEFCEHWLGATLALLAPLLPFTLESQSWAESSFRKGSCSVYGLFSTDVGAFPPLFSSASLAVPQDWLPQVWNLKPSLALAR